MFVSLVADLQIDDESSGVIPVTHGEAMQSELFRQLRELDGQAATQVHGDGDTGSRAYTISPIWPTRPPRPVEPRGFTRIAAATSGGEAPCDGWFRLTGFERQTSQTLLRLAGRAEEWIVLAHPHRTRFRILRWHLESSNWSGQDELASLWDRAAADGEIVLRFYSATTFAASGDGGWGEHQPLPVPDLVFTSLHERLVRAWPQLPMPVLHAAKLKRMSALGRFQIASEMMYFARRKHSAPGFTGRCTFLLSRGLSTPERRYYNFLADAAFYLGAGQFTSWGMGQVRRLPSWNEGD